jgi:multiple sugar transport system ATP-binding protein
MARIDVKSVYKRYEMLEVIHGIDLTIDDGAFTVFVGPSGCGKSTLLRMMAGLEDLNSGEVHIDGQRCDHLMPSARGMAMVFQSYALYPHMSVEQNLRFGLENARLPRVEVETRVRRAAQILQIESLLKRRPNQLSGGQSQRVAIGRAIVKEPKAFLFDEPLSNLDAELRVKMRAELVALHKRLGTTMIYVTHDQVEAMTMADKIVVLRDGIVEQVGAPVELYARPRNRFVAGFLGAPQMNFLPGRVQSVADDGIVVLLDAGVVLTMAWRAGIDAGNACVVGIRPEHLVPADAGVLALVVEDTEILGSETIVHGLLPSDERVTFSMRGISRLNTGDPVRLELPESFVHLFREDGLALHQDRPWSEDYIR